MTSRPCDCGSCCEACGHYPDCIRHEKKERPMAKKTVHFVTSASTTITIDTDLTDPDDIVEQAYNEGEFPTICAQCSGWGREQELEIGDDWEPVEENNKPLITSGD